MVSSIPDILFSRLSELVAAQMGLCFPKKRWHDLERGIRSAAQEFGFKDVESCIQWLLSSSFTKKQIEILASHLTVGETYFFREREIFEILEECILPELVCSRRKTSQNLRVWSAGCSTGEEPYSIAILLSKMIPDLKDWNITLLATDINPRFLRKASEGVYGKWSFRDTPLWVKERYFKKTRDGCFEVLPPIRKMVTFSYLNLVEDTYPSFLTDTNAIDIIFCRNVLMYFVPEQAKKIIKNLHRSLVDGGWLIVSPAETSHVLFSEFMTVNLSDLFFYRKDSRMLQTVRDFPMSLVEELKVSTPLPSFFVTMPEVTCPPEAMMEPRPVPCPALPWEVEEQNRAKSQPASYIEALALYQQGRYAEAVDRSLALVSHNQNDTQVISLLSRAYANQGRLAEAHKWCEKAIAIDRLNPGFHYLCAIILQELGLIDEAIISLKRALYLDQNFVLVHFALGNLTRRQGKFKESERHFENALLLLNGYREEEILPESEGVTAGRLAKIIASMTGKDLQHEEESNIR